VVAWTQNGILYVDGLTPGTTWRVYSLTGALIYTGTATADKFPSIGGAGVVTITLPGRGIYIITNGSSTVKIVN